MAGADDDDTALLLVLPTNAGPIKDAEHESSDLQEQVQQVEKYFQEEYYCLD